MNNYRPMPTMTPAVKWIILINAVMFLITKGAGRQTGEMLVDMLGLHLPQSPMWGVWQYITYMFMHGNLGHVFFNMFAVFMFGRVLENVWGTRRFLIFYFVTAIGAALLNSLIGWIELRNVVESFYAFENTPTPDLLAEFIRKHLPNASNQVHTLLDQWINNPDSPQLIMQGKALYLQIVQMLINVPMIGASGAVFGILLAFGMLFPNTELYMMFIPIPIKAKYFVFGYGFIELVMGLKNNPGDNIAHFAHLGGMLFGYLLLLYWKKRTKRFY
ncbi:MAG: rhomboid family intramembrane serine protease [Marinifilaceae bacterium]